MVPMLPTSSKQQVQWSQSENQRSCFALLGMQNNSINCVASLGKY